MLIYKDLNTCKEICTNEDALKCVEDTANIPNIIAIDINTGSSSLLDLIFENAAIDKAYLDEDYFIINKWLNKQTDDFLAINNLNSYKKEFWKIIAIINTEVNNYKDFIKDAKDSLRDFENIVADEIELKKVLELYSKEQSNRAKSALYQSTKITSDILTDITFHFAKNSKGIKISNSFVLIKIMSLLNKYSFQESPSVDFSKEHLKFKKNIALVLFKFFRMENESWHANSARKAYERIATIFTLAGDDEDKVNADSVKMWIHRTKNNRL